MTKRIGIYDKWARPHQAAAADPFHGESSSPMRRQAAARGGMGALPHGLTAAESRRLNAKFESMLPSVSSGASSTRSFFDGLLPPDAELAPNAGAGLRSAMRRQADFPGGVSTGSTSNGLLTTSQRPYQPEFDSQDRQSYPIHRILANRYWSLFYKLDPVIGTCIDLFSELPWGNFELSGEGVDGEIKETMEHMVDVCQLRSFLPYMVREFMVKGEAAPHMFFDDDKGIWTYVTLHNPDQLEVVHAPFMNMDPYVEFVPDDKLRQVLTQNNEIVRHLRESMPPDLLARLLSRENIALSPVNCTFLPRKQHFYDTRGTSIISRMWRILMYEDALFNASIATARRMAAPLKIAKLGNAATNWIPGPEHEKRLLECIAQAEMDPGAWIAYHFGVNFELVGVQERVMKVDTQAEFIERTKLIALGISKSFLTGEVTYASASAGLTIFLRRLKAMREFFESKWLYPKFFRQAAEINKWVKPTQAELAHRVRVRRSHKELIEDKRYIVPTIEWDRSLDPSVDSELISAMNSLAQLGVKFSKTTLMASVNRDFETETKQLVKDTETEQRILKAHPELLQPQGQPGGGASGGGPPPIMPGVPPDTFEGFGGPPGGGDAGAGGAPGAPDMVDVSPGGPAPAPQGAALTAAEGDESRSEVSLLAKDLIRVVGGHEPEQELWDRALEVPEVHAALDSGDGDIAWDAVQTWLLDQDYPAAVIVEIETLLRQRGFISNSGSDDPMQADDLLGDSDGDGFLTGPR